MGRNHGRESDPNKITLIWYIFGKFLISAASWVHQEEVIRT
jgi:hypothetical protein